MKFKYEDRVEVIGYEFFEGRTGTIADYYETLGKYKYYVELDGHFKKMISLPEANFKKLETK